MITPYSFAGVQVHSILGGYFITGAGVCFMRIGIGHHFQSLSSRG